MPAQESHSPRDPAVEETSGYCVTWKNVSCKIETGGLFSFSRTVDSLTDCSGFARSSEALAIMGSSGAGKTTLVGEFGAEEEKRRETKWKRQAVGGS